MRETRTSQDYPALAEPPPRVNILGVGVHATNMSDAVARICWAVEARQKGYVCVTGVHGIMESQQNEELRKIQFFLRDPQPHF